MPAIEIRNLETRLGDRTVHRGLDLTVDRGQLLAIAGSSGAGKTVLLRVMTLLERPADGTVTLFGRSAVGLSRRDERRLRRRMGVMFQRGALFTGLSVVENVMFPLREYTRLPEDVIRELAAVKLHLAGLETDAATRMPAELSGGMTKRVALARALALDPELLFLDEPTAGLDPVSASDFDHLIVQLRDLLGLTVVVVTHDVDSLWQIADSVAFLGDGVVLANDRPDVLARSPVPAVSAYFGGARMQRAAERTWNPE